MSDLSEVAWSAIEAVRAQWSAAEMVVEKQEEVLAEAVNNRDSHMDSFNSMLAEYEEKWPKEEAKEESGEEG